VRVCLCGGRGGFGDRYFGMRPGRMCAVLSLSFDIGLGSIAAVGFIGVAIKVEAENLSCAVSLSLVCVGNLLLLLPSESGLFDTDAGGDDDGPSAGVGAQVPELSCLGGWKGRYR